MNARLSIANYEAVIFDMDGVLIDSEPQWKIAMENVFKSVGLGIQDLAISELVLDRLNS